MSENKFIGWVARNSEAYYNELILVPGEEPPSRMATYWLAGFTWGYTVIPNEAYPELKWEDEPVKVEIILKKVDE